MTTKKKKWTVSQPNCSLADIKALLHLNRELWTPKKEKRTVAQPNCLLSDIKTLFHRNRELWPPKKEKQIGSQSQRTLHCYLEKDKPELFPISTKISALLHWKRQDLTVLHPNRELWKQIDRTVINSKLKPLIRHQDTISCQQRTVTTKKKKTVSQPNCSLLDIKILFHPNRELWPPKKEKRTVSQSQRALHCFLKKTRLNCSPYQ